MGGCCQCTLAALQDAMPFLTSDLGLFRAASCLDGGVTPTGLHQCGSFTAAGLAIGYLCGRTRDEIFFGDRTLARQLLKRSSASSSSMMAACYVRRCAGRSTATVFRPCPRPPNGPHNPFWKPSPDIRYLRFPKFPPQRRGKNDNLRGGE